MKSKIIIGISGASGTIMGIKLLEFLKKTNYETHLVMSNVSKKIIEHETKYKPKDVEKLADFSYEEKDFFSPIASGSFKTLGMVIVPCSMKTLAGISHGYADNLITRAADVCLKEGRKLIIVPRETPLNRIHIENMEKLSRAGAIILPPVLSFYSEAKSVDDMINYIIGKILDVLNIENNVYKRWGEK